MSAQAEFKIETGVPVTSRTCTAPGGAAPMTNGLLRQYFPTCMS